jgi:mRNA interferase MazF
MKRGEVRWFRFPAPDKRRPVLILTRTAAIPYLGDVTVAPITSTLRVSPSQVRLAQGRDMPRECVINLDRLTTVSQRDIGPVIVTLRADQMERVRLALLFALGFESTGEVGLAEVSALWEAGRPADRPPAPAPGRAHRRKASRPRTARAGT